MRQILLEYNAEQGGFHWNMTDSNGFLSDKPNTFGWAAIANTSLEKARIFCNAMQTKIHRRKHLKLSPYTVDHIRKEWKLFCFIYNSILHEIDEFSNDIEELDEHFNETRSLARLGNSHFSDDKEDNGWDWGWDYDPLSYHQSNYD